MRKQPDKRSDYRHFQTLLTRWSDNDMYGHVNNVVFLSWFDTAVNQFLIDHEVLDPTQGATIGLVVQTGCDYFASVSFPEHIEAGVRVTKIGNSSVRYEVGIFRTGEESAAAQGHFVHVYVERVSRRPVQLPEAMRGLLQSIEVKPA